MPNRVRTIKACGEELQVEFTHDVRRELEEKHKLTIGAVPDALHTAVGLENLLLGGLEGYRRGHAANMPPWTLERVRALLNHPDSPPHYEWAHEVDQAFGVAIRKPKVEGDKEQAAAPGTPGGKA